MKYFIDVYMVRMHNMQLKGNTIVYWTISCTLTTQVVLTIGAIRRTGGARLISCHERTLTNKVTPKVVNNYCSSGMNILLTNEVTLPTFTCSAGSNHGNIISM